MARSIGIPSLIIFTSGEEKGGKTKETENVKGREHDRYFVSNIFGWFLIHERLFQRFSCEFGALSERSINVSIYLVIKNIR